MVAIIRHSYTGVVGTRLRIGLILDLARFIMAPVAQWQRSRFVIGRSEGSNPPWGSINEEDDERRRNPYFAWSPK